jgi:hypothetical protein
MNTVQNPAAERLFKKLSALRATLPADEREILDQFIKVEEVTAHRMVRKAASKRAVTRKSAEVTAHKISKRAASKKAASKKSPSAASKR